MEYNFDVRREKCYLKDGTYVGREAIRRADNGNVLGVVSETYKLLEHGKAAEAVERSLDRFGIWDKKKVSMTKNGARLFLEYEFPEMEYNIGKIKWGKDKGLDDLVHPRLIMTNSYDGRLKFGFLLGAYRLVCSNGLRVGHDIFEIKAKHTSQLNPDVVIAKAQEALNMFKDKIYPRYQTLTDEKINNLESFMINLKDEKKIPSKLAEIVLKNLNGGEEFTQWDIYNEFTRYLTHEYKKSEERREDLGRIVASAFGI